MPAWIIVPELGQAHIIDHPEHIGELTTVDPYNGDPMAEPYYTCYTCSTIHPA